jgi:pimeloyl-ACP methyl ester carboxylesterase
LGLGALGCATATAPSGAEPQPSLAGATFVLVHGAWHGGWCWRDVAARLSAQGARVFTPTLTGLGERAHLRDPAPSLDTHVRDVGGVLEAEELQGVVLVGHSYGGMVVTGAADRWKDRLAHVVYFDAALPEDGQTMITQRPGMTAADAEAALAQIKALAPDGAWMNPVPAAAFGVPPGSEAAAWIDRRLTPHPLRTWTDPLPLPSGGARGLARTYVWCNAPSLANSAFPLHYERVLAGEAGPGWRVEALAAGHDAMVTHPRETADLFARAWAASAKAPA